MAMEGCRELNARTEFPSNRFHQTVALLLWICSIHFTVTLVLLSLFYFTLSVSLSVIALLLLFMIIPIDDRSKFGRKLGRYISRHGASYFPVKLHLEDSNAFDPNRSYVFGYEPHSVLPAGLVVLVDHIGFLPLSKIKALGSSAVFFTPFLRHIWTWLGLTSATRKNFSSLLASGTSVVLIPGGVQESFFLEHGVEVAFIKTRKGFVRIAIQHGSPLVPVFCFGQSKIFRWWKPGGGLYLKFSRAIKFTPIFFWGIFGTPLPCQHPMHVVVGKPIEVKRNPHPTTEEVDEVHTKFVEALKDLFARHKTRVGYHDTQLKIL